MNIHICIYTPLKMYILLFKAVLAPVPSVYICVYTICMYIHT